MDARDHKIVRQLFDEYLRMYAGRDDALTARFSEDFSGFTGGGDFLVKDREQWVAITRQDFAQIKDPIDIELKDLSIQSLAETVAVATSFFTIRLPIKDHVLSRETARLVLIFRKEDAGWRISHSSISIPYYRSQEGEVYPVRELSDRTRFLEELVAERTLQLSSANERLRLANEALTKEVAERKQTAAALQVSEERYRSILNASPDDITITDAKSRVVLVSPAAMAIFGYSRPEEFIGRPITDFMVAEDRARAEEQMARKRRGISIGPAEYRALRRDGTVLDVEVNSEFIRDAAGARTGIVFIVRDISERKRAEVEKEKLEALNRRLQKVESLGTMAAAIAHHFNNQLQAVMFGVELAMHDVPREAAVFEVLAEALGSARKAAEVSGSMLTYLGQTTGKREPLDLSEACLRSLSGLRAFTPKGVVLETDFPAAGPGVNANEGEIQQVLSNLAANAFEAMTDRGGAVRLSIKTVAVATIPLTGRFPIGCQLHDPLYCCLEVSDSGCGVPAENLDKLFDPFFSSKFTGRGLGLAVVLGIVRAHGGAITVETAKDQGSTFRVFLPVSDRALTRRALPVARPARAKASGTVLVVDDEPLVRKGLARTLTRLGYVVLTAEDGVAALHLFEQHHQDIGCVLCDVTMPRMNGWETLTALRKLAPGIAVILTSGYSEADVMAGHHAELPQAFLRKPHDSAALVLALDRVLQPQPSC